MNNLKQIFTSCRRNPLNRILRFKNKQIDINYVMTWYLLQFKIYTLHASL